MQPEIAMLSVCFILHISAFAQDHSAGCPEHLLARHDPSWMWVARTTKNFLQKPQDHLMISSQHFLGTLWLHLSFSQAHFSGTSYTATSQYTHWELFSPLCKPSSLHNDEMGHSWSDEESVCSLPHSFFFFFLYLTSSQNCTLGHLDV